jgi:cell division protein FtsB
VLILLSAWAAPLDLISAATGIYRTTALFVVAGGFFLLILLYYSTVLTRLADQNKQLAQELALLRQEVEALRQNVDAGDSKSQAAAQPAVADNVQSLPESQST